MKRFALLSVLVTFGLAACEQHDFDGPNGTKQLHTHGEHADDEGSH